MPDYPLAGVFINSHGEPDYSGALYMLPPLPFDKSTVKNLFHRLSSQREFERNLTIQHTITKAVKDGSWPGTPKELEDRLWLELKNMGREQILNSVGDTVKHYHRTDMDSFEKIVESGALLSRTELEKRGVKIEQWSSSQDVMFTVDMRQSDNSIRLGLDDNEVVGAVGKDLVFVFDKQIMHLPDYNPVNQYPTASRVPLDICQAIIVSDPKNIHKIQALIADTYPDIQILPRAGWEQALKSDPELEQAQTQPQHL